MAEITIHKMFEAGMHFGHSARFWNPKIKPYIYGTCNGYHIIDLDKSYPLFVKAMDFLYEVSAGGGKVLFVGCKRSATRTLTENAIRCGMYYVTRRWLGGTLTNFRTIRRSIDNYLDLQGKLERGNFSDVSKKEMIKLGRELEKMRRTLEGIKDMVRPPKAMFVVDVMRERIAVKEAQVLGIPIVAILDTNCDLNGLDYIIPGNDDAFRAISLYADMAADAIIRGAQESERRAALSEEVKLGGKPASARKGS